MKTIVCPHCGYENLVLSEESEELFCVICDGNLEDKPEETGDRIDLDDIPF